MKRELKVTSDGSPTLYSEKWDQHYHSVHGAFNESMHVFLLHGLKTLDSKSVSILEMGMGTGINVFLTWRESRGAVQSIQFHTLEAFPLAKEEWSQLQVGTTPRELEVFDRIHNSSWTSPTEIDKDFILRKENADILAWEPKRNAYDIIYFDAFAPSTQPELWSVEIFQKCRRALKPNGILVTYCAQGQVKRNMKEAGFEVERLPGPPGKREMTRARKPNNPSEKPSYTVRVYGILEKDNCLLVSRELYKGVRMFKFPGGGMEEGEGAIDALKREFVEELNLEVEVVDHLYTTDFFTASTFDQDIQVISIYYLVHPVDESELSTLNVDELGTMPQNKKESFQWYPLERLSENMFTFTTERAAWRRLVKLRS
ncbi:tRNA (5-methylaminomethyl-2-thiouridine)(34)-methyltransferase MnmD [Phaeocystidibacter luteus]|uniref:tRNA (5-methylaminomethyl-2-thiouridine)(34)-methyltransferase MnmD n=1 Tax=Phaeocystidibacter luteus TaxID=911197 RepID=A0A6N6RMI8_9FLAO|nr:tRNA (5-methylaminomethyl-2-thiouridine)(34)-methyltransferase MnmD [Phaeocystidibacter luteus]KAB2814783.1 tRNA (5-methylaminomethyl-2-thiouridine)(34)-methyltransferase MnmD [Phaeocystidibacter luteus]